jgi:glycosyltransferase involved in cell wall biosynthesis
MSAPPLPPVSVVLPAYNAERFLARALGSVVAQTHGELDIVVVDDGSTDGTLGVAQDFARRDNRVRVFAQGNGRIARALNHGIACARHEWIARMDADDVMEPNRIERQLGFLAANPDLSVASSLVRYIDEDERVVGWSRSPFTRRATIARYFQRNRMVALNHPAAMMRKSAVTAVGGYRPEFVPTEDCDLWCRLLERGYQLLVQPEYLLRYRVYGESTTGQSVTVAERRLEWVLHCSALRRRDAPEITFEAFQQQLERQPWWLQMNRRRSERGSTLYGRAVLGIAAGDYTHAAGLLLLAAVLRPRLVLGRVGPRLTSAPLRAFGWRVG